ncbi:MAG TPA: hypothetical protein VFJ70_02170 [Burkholderiales bacterium]|nr:hypothetical protein [Burkholderiales bacterium]
METWHCKALGNGVAASAPSRRIQELFSPMFTASGQPSDMAVFTRSEANQVTAYFSPRASRLAMFFGARPCEKPASDRIGLLVGDARCWAILFPDRKRRAA